MKKLCSILAIVLSVMLLLASLPIMSLVASADTATEVVIFAANPAKVGGAGANATATYFSQAGFGSYAQVNVLSDANGEYYHTEWHGLGNVNAYSYFKSGYTSADLPWLADAKVASAIIPYIRMTFKYRVYMNNGGYTQLHFSAGVADHRANNENTIQSAGQDCHVVRAFIWNDYIENKTAWTNADSGVGKANFSTFADGYIYLRSYAYSSQWPDNQFMTDIRDVKFTISTADYAKINAALSNAGSSYTAEKLVKDWTEADAETYEIMGASPEKFYDVNGGVATGVLNSGTQNAADTFVKYDSANNTYYYSQKHKNTTNSGSNIDYNVWSYFKTGYSSKELPWLADSKVTNALAGYVVANLKYRMNYDDGATWQSMSHNADIGIADADCGGAKRNNLLIVNWDSRTPYNIGDWRTVSKTLSTFPAFKDGYMATRTVSVLGGQWAAPLNATTGMDVCDISFKVKSCYFDEINAKLAEAGSDYTIEQIISEWENAKYKKDTSNYYSIWNTNEEDLYDEDVEITNIPTDSELSNKGFGSALIEKENNSYFYHTTISVSENGGKGGSLTGGLVKGNVNNNSTAYGWLSNKALLNVLAPYLYFDFDYRVADGSGALKDDTVLIINAATEYTAQVAQLGGVYLCDNGEWIHNGPVKIPATEFLTEWYNGYINFSLWSESSLPETVIIDLKNLSLSLRAEDKDIINANLKQTGLDLCFDDLACNDPDYEATDNIWFANAKYAANREDISIVSSNNDGSYYNFNLSSGANAVLKSGFDSTVKNFGWLANNDFLNAMAPYLYVAFDYRTTAAVNSANLTLSANTATATQFATVSLNDTTEWKSYFGKISANSFGGAWNDGDLVVSTNSASQIGVDIRDVRLALKYTDYDEINALVVINGSFSKIENFLKDRTYGYYDIDEDTKLVDVYVCLLESAKTKKYDANLDDKVDLLDLIAYKKALANDNYLPEFIIKNVLASPFGVMDSTNLADMRNKLLTGKTTATYNDPLVVGLEQEHPGVVGMDAKYTLTVNDRETGAAINSGCTVTANNENVIVNGLDLTVPYSVREAGNLTVTVTYGGKSGRYTFDFAKFTSNPTLRDDFDTLNTELWASSKSSTVAPAVEDGKLMLTAVDGTTPQVYTGDAFKQAYGCFSASMKSPASGEMNCAVWLRNSGTYIKNVKNPNKSGGEIDIVEYFPSWGNRYSSTIHWNGWDTTHRYSGSDKLQGANLVNNYNTFSVVWTPDAIYSYLNGELMRCYQGVGVAENSGAMEIVINNSPSVSPASPATMYVDWVEVYGLAD